MTKLIVHTTKERGCAVPARTKNFPIVLTGTKEPIYLTIKEANALADSLIQKIDEVYAEVDEPRKQP